MSVDVIVGLQRGDEGKGRFVDLLASNYKIIARANGGANAGHTVVPEEGKDHLALHQVPSGVAYPGKLNIIGTGVYLDPSRILVEIGEIRAAGLEVSKKIYASAPRPIWYCRTILFSINYVKPVRAPRAVLNPVSLLWLLTNTYARASD
jgi:adenylosuccinate synthase